MGKLYRKAARIVDNQNHIKEKVDFLLIHAVVFFYITNNQNTPSTTTI
jgi:large-conductance mechanosensitive channel